MVALAFMRRLWRYVYDEMNLLGKILFLPSMVFMFSVLFVMGMVELFLLDIPYIPAIMIEYKMSLKQAINSMWYI